MLNYFKKFIVRRTPRSASPISTPTITAGTSRMKKPCRRSSPILAT